MRFWVRCCVGIGIALWGVVCGAVAVCTQCGYEVPEQGRFCSHCGGAVKSGGDVPVADETMSDGDGDVAATIIKAWREDVGLAREMAESTPAVAYLIFRNALAYPPFVPDFLSAEQAMALHQELKACERSVFFGGAPCLACGGTGKKQLRALGMDGTVSEKAISSTVDCTECRGRKAVLRPRTASDLRLVRGAAVREFETLMRSHGRYAEGDGWIPLELKGQLTVQQVAMARSAVASPCGNCLGSGMADCTACRNRGMVACRASGCDKGWVLKPAASKNVKPTREACGVCDGTGWVTCVPCAGKASQACRPCSGTGARAACNVCRGEGVSSCRKCKGVGGECLECKGEGVTLCSGCKGDGRRGR